MNDLAGRLWMAPRSRSWPDGALDAPNERRIEPSRMYREELTAGTLLVAAFDGKVVAYDKRTGVTVWSHVVRAKKPSFGHPRPRPMQLAAQQGRLFVLSACGGGGMFSAHHYAELTVIELTTGRMLWTQNVDREAKSFSATLAVDDQLAIVFHHDLVIAFSVQTGQPMWHRISEHGDGGMFVAEVQVVLNERVRRPLL